ncbi:MAG: prolipoprotein diacylglyceryl transferase [Calditrichia bacterium]|nr:prolipoprotein diacylglyceryl transferase [Calditrichia bacterium]
MHYQFGEPLFQVGSISVYGYSLMLSIAFILGIVVALRESKKTGMKHEHILGVCPYIIIGSYLGSVLFNPVLSLPSFILTLGKSAINWDGGYVGWGGFLGALTFAMIYLKKNKVNGWRLVDTLVPSIGLGILLIKIGCFLNGCCFGVRTDLPWGINFGDFPRHPTQLYHSLGGLIIFFLAITLKGKSRFDGWLFLVCLMIYSIVRIIEGVWRDNPKYWLNLSTMQWTSILILSVSLIALFLNWRKKSISLTGKKLLL